MTGDVTRSDLSPTEADPRTATIDPKAAIQTERRRLKIQLGGVLIANLVAIGLLIFASLALLAPDLSCPGLSGHPRPWS